MAYQESIMMGYQKMVAMTFLICFFSLGAMAMVGRGQAYNNPTYFWVGICMLVLGVGGLLSYALYKFILEFNAGFLIYNIIHSGDNKPLQETLYFESIDEITSPIIKEDLSRFIKPQEEELLPLLDSANFFYTRIRHRGDRPNNGQWSETDYITLLPFTNAIQFFGWRGSFICENYPRLNPKLAIVYGEMRGSRESITTLELTRFQEFMSKVFGRTYDTRVIQSIPVYFILGCTATANYSTLMAKLPLLKAEWIEENARGVQAIDASDRESEIEMLYNIIENDKKLLARKLRPAFLETPVLESAGFRGRIERMSDKLKWILVMSLIFAGIIIAGFVSGNITA